MRDGRWLVGWGAAGAFHVPARLFADVSVRLHADGTAVVRSSLQEVGVGVATATVAVLGVPRTGRCSPALPSRRAGRLRRSVSTTRSTASELSNVAIPANETPVEPEEMSGA
ncbi:hypothetical protein [Nakamurella leprariae]|nr:hypothetical protein [Nakamurella leprariae]